MVIQETEISQIRLVRDLMTVGVPTCGPETPVDELARKMLDQGWETVVVLDGNEGHALGIVSQDELVKTYGHEDINRMTVGEIMRDGVPQVPPDIPLTVAAQIMNDLNVRVLFIMHHAGGISYPAAMISYRHLLRHLSAKSTEDLKDLGIGAERQNPRDLFIQRRDAARMKNRKY